MARAHSPGYPNFGLTKAVGYVRAIFDADRRNPIDRLVAVKHMGYTSLSGASDKALGSLAHFRLIEKVGKGELRVTQAAVDILHPDTPDDRKRALRTSAFAPTIFKQLRERFPTEHVSADAIQSYLKRENFLDRAIGPVTTAYIDTVRYLEREKAFESGGVADSGGADLTPPDDDDDGVVYGGAAVGDLIQWESGGELRLENATRVRAVSEDRQWLWVDGSETGIPMTEAIVDTKGKPADPAVTRQAPKLPLPESVFEQEAKPGKRREVFALHEGDVVLTYPEDLSLESYEDLESYINIFLRKSKRRAEAERKTHPWEGSEP